MQIDLLKILRGAPVERAILGTPSFGASRPWRWIELGIAHYPFQIATMELMEIEADAPH